MAHKRNWNWKRIEAGEYVSGNGKFTIVSYRSSVTCHYASNGRRYVGQHRPRGPVWWLWGHIPSMKSHGFECGDPHRTRRAAIAELESEIASRPEWFPSEDIPQFCGE